MNSEAKQMEQRELLEQFMEAIQMLNRYLRRNESVEQGDRVITRVQWLILRHVNRYGERTIGELADRLDVRSSTMSQMIDRLELAGLVYRVQDERDARARLVRLTDEGRRVIEHLRNVRMELLSQLFQQLSEDEQQTLTHLMTKLFQQLPQRSE
jgi:MarR family transcriptional regulator, organic hydroperoxide resistance regulator